MKQSVYVYGHFDHGLKFMKYVQPPKADRRQHGTSHAVVTVTQGPCKGQSFAVPIHTLGKGLSCKIWKWFVRVGIILVIVAMFVVFLPIV